MIVLIRDNIETILSSINKHTAPVVKFLSFWIAYHTGYNSNNNFYWVRGYSINGAVYEHADCDKSKLSDNCYVLPIFDL